jgi:hypothetical protein
MALKTFAELLKPRLEAAVKAFEQHASGILRREVIKQLSAKFPRSNYSSEADWGRAITEELEAEAKEYSALIPEEALLSRSYATQLFLVIFLKRSSRSRSVWTRSLIGSSNV